MNPEDRSPFGILLQQFREEAALSQSALAERSGVSLRGISDLERGARTMPRLETVRMLADGLELSGDRRAALIAARHASAPQLPQVRPGLTLKVPHIATSFIGRSIEIRAVVDTLQDGYARCITLTGPGGVGKTRIAIEVAFQLRAVREMDIAFVDLLAIRDSALVVETIANAVDLAEGPPGELRQSLLSQIQQRPMLIILDNVEHLPECGPDIEWLLTNCPDLLIIATSRVILHIPEEHVFEIDPLPVPESGNLSLENLSDSVMLFAARAHAAHNGFLLDEGNLPDVAEIVTHLQGMPLAIELAAARIRTFPAATMARHLQTQLGILTSSQQIPDGRHSSMSQTINWSYELLGPREQELFRAISIFPVGCTLETAIALLDIDQRLTSFEVMEAMTGLVDNSLVRAREGPDGDIRYRMLASIREFGLGQLVKAGEENRIRLAAHASWCVPLGNVAEFLFHRADAPHLRPRIRAEKDNLQEHINWLMANDLPEQALEFSSSFKTCPQMRGEFVETADLLPSLIHHPKNQGETPARMKGLLRHANVLLVPQLARAAYEEAAEIARTFEAWTHLAMAVEGVGLILTGAGRFAEAMPYFEQMGSAAEKGGDYYLVGSSYSLRAYVARVQGRDELAVQLIGAARERFETAGSITGISSCEFDLSAILESHGDLDRAEVHLVTGLELMSGIGADHLEPMKHMRLGRMSLQRQDLDHSIAFLATAVEKSRELENVFMLAESLHWLAKAQLQAGDVSNAILSHEESLEIYTSLQVEVLIMPPLDARADIAIACGDPLHAAWCIGVVDAHHRTSGTIREEYPQGEHIHRMARLRSLMDESQWSGAHAEAMSLSHSAVIQEIRDRKRSHPWRYELQIGGN